MKDTQEAVRVQKAKNELRAARLRFKGLMDEADRRNLSAALHVSPDSLSPPACLLGEHYEVDAFRGLVSPLRSQSWSAASLATRLQEIFGEEGIEQDPACLLFEAEPAWVELTPHTLLQLLPQLPAFDMDWALLEVSGAWCCFVNRHGNLGFSRKPR